MACIGGAVEFILAFEANLHCTQNTSFRTAAFDVTPHPEEGTDGQPLPAVYTSAYAWLLRLYLALAVLGAVSLPGIVPYRRIRLAMSASTIGAGALWPIANSMLLGRHILGERFYFLGLAAAVWGFVLGIVALGTAVATDASIAPCDAPKPS